jgi:hypothetical protein
MIIYYLYFCKYYGKFQVIGKWWNIQAKIDVNIQDVKDILQTLQIGKACGDDVINHQMLKATSETMCLPLSILFGILYESNIIVDIFI